jgi:hypothetical protein
LPDSNQKGVAHRHNRPSPDGRMLPKRSSGRRFDETLKTSRIIVPEVEFILPDNNTFGHLDLRSLVDDFDNSGGDD